MSSAHQLILVVEDEAAIAETIVYALQTEGFMPLWKTTGRDALAALATQPVALAALMFFTRKVDWFAQEAGKEAKISERG